LKPIISHSLSSLLATRLETHNITAGRAVEPFSESNAQVKRLITRDRKQFLGNDGDILDKFETEFGESEEAEAATAAATATATATATAAAEATAAAAAATAATAAAAKAASAAAATAAASAAAAPKPASPFGGGGPAAGASPFGSGGGAAGAGSPPSSPFLASAPGASLNARSKIEPAGLSPTLGPDPLAPSVPVIPGAAGFFSRITLTSVVLVLSFSTIIGIMLATFRVAVNAGAIRLAGVE